MVAVRASPSPMSPTTASRNHDSLRSMPPAGGRPSHLLPRKPLVPSNAPANRIQLRDTSLCPVESKYQDDGCAPSSRLDIDSVQTRLRAANKLSKALPKLPLARDAAFEQAGDEAFMIASPSLALDGDATTLSRSRGRRCATDPAIEFNDVGGNLNLDAASTPGQLDATALGPYKERLFRNSRESDETASSGHQAGSVHSSAPTSTSSIYGVNDVAECSPNELSPEGSVLDGRQGQIESIPQFHYHHQRDYSPRPSNGNPDAARASLSPDQLDSTGHGGRHLAPLSGYFGRASQSRPQSSYSLWSDNAPRGPSPSLSPRGSHLRAPSLQSRKSPDARPSSYAELLNVPYPQQAPAPLTLDNSNLRSAVGNNASLLSTQKTLDMYRQNVKKTNDFSIQYSFAVFLISTAQELGLDMADAMARKPSPHPPRDMDSSSPESFTANPLEMVREARQILQRLANGGYPFAQYYLADGFASGLFSKGKEDYNAAFPLFVLAAKHGHAESAYRAALCYEFGWGCRKDPAKAVQFLRLAASKRHPGAMTRLGKACLSGDLGEKRYREGIKWLKLATEAADAQYNNAPYQLGCLYETGYGDDVFEDLDYAAELFTQAAELGHPEANYRMGEAYEHGTLNCPKDAALSVHFYTGAAERGHAAAMMGLCAWYMVGAPPIMDQDEEEAYEWARRSAQLGYAKAQYAVGYFTEMGIGCRRDMLEANVWYVKAADAGDERARQRLAVIQAAASGGGMPMEVAPPRNAKMAKDDKDCVVM